MKIEKISGIVPFTEKNIDIEALGKSLILTGKNGCGKTQLLNTIFNLLVKARSYNTSLINLNNQIEAQYKNIKIYKNNILGFSTSLDRLTSQLKQTKDKTHKIKFEKNIKETIRKIEEHEKALENNDKRISSIKEEISSLSCYVEKKGDSTLKNTKIKYSDVLENKLPIILFFEALRSSSFKPVQNITSMENEANNIRGGSGNPRNPTSGSFIEKFLANWEVNSALREKKNDHSVTKELESWKEQLVDSLKILLDDDSTSIEFDENSLNYIIKQKDKVNFSFRDLSSGYSAILKVFSELLMITEVSEYFPNTISGFVIIDEIDAHLHPSLQRKVLPFFTELFPNIQFIVSTHSPFVINSNDNTVIYDLSSLKTIDTNDIDLRYYTSDLITENFLNVSTKSDWLNNKIDQLTSTENLENLEKIIKEMEASENILDSETLTFYFQAKRQLQKMAASNKNV